MFSSRMRKNSKISANILLFCNINYLLYLFQKCKLFIFLHKQDSVKYLFYAYFHLVIHSVLRGPCRERYDRCFTTSTHTKCRNFNKSAHVSLAVQSHSSEFGTLKNNCCLFTVKPLDGKKITFHLQSPH
jgi:hypothetical protein